MDAVAYTMAATSTRNLREGEDPDRGMRLFWCVVITPYPAIDSVYRRFAGNYENHRGANRLTVPCHFTDQDRRLCTLAKNRTTPTCLCIR